MTTHYSFSKAREEFERAWNNPAHTRIEPESVDVITILHDYYSTSEALPLTKQILWDAEVKKAWDPGTYIPGVVSEGEAWGRKSLENGEELLMRASRQRAWATGVDEGPILEEVYLSPGEQSVLFFGRAELSKDAGPDLRASTHQPLFHVEHAVRGTDSHPLNLWRIVHLTAKKDDSLIERQMMETGTPEWLRRFIAIYVETDLGIKLTPR
ncbi:MAG: hypothetical protein ACI8XO_002505 [Verrucomicrobiales bacterium]|jgi:hypothetical protein